MQTCVHFLHNSQLRKTKKYKTSLNGMEEKQTNKKKSYLRANEKKKL